MGNLQVGWAKLTELRQALQRIRAAGRPVVVYLASNPSDGRYYLASAADWIVGPPVSLVNLDGLRSEATFYKGAMDKLGITFEFERVGEYKSAVEPFSRESMSAESREVRQAILDDIFEELTEKIAAGRDIPIERVIELIDNGPYISIEAQDAGLIDQIAYEDELDGIVRQHIADRARRINLKGLTRREYHRNDWGPAPKVAVIFAQGTILSGTDRKDLLTGEIMGARTIAEALRRARRDWDVKAIVLRIDSPGGSGFASDVILREVQKTAEAMPLVISMSDVAASGGYYIACPADSIFALPTTITGSIGVYFGKVSLAGLYDKIGVKKEVLTRGARADMYSLNRPFNEKERETLRRQMEMFYDNFIKIVARGRNSSPEEVDRVARGRVWTGKAAVKIGLVDDYGGLPRAIAAAAQMAGIENEDFQVEILPRPRWRPFRWPVPDWLSLWSGEKDIFTEVSAFADEHVWYLLPWRLVIK